MVIVGHEERVVVIHHVPSGEVVDVAIVVIVIAVDGVVIVLLQIALQILMQQVETRVGHSDHHVRIALRHIPGCKCPDLRQVILRAYLRVVRCAERYGPGGGFHPIELPGGCELLRPFSQIGLLGQLHLENAADVHERVAEAVRPALGVLGTGEHLRHRERSGPLQRLPLNALTLDGLLVFGPHLQDEDSGNDVHLAQHGEGHDEQGK